MKRWTWLMALMLALMIPLQGCTSNPPKDEGEEQNQQEQQKEEQEKDEETGGAAEMPEEAAAQPAEPMAEKHDPLPDLDDDFGGQKVSSSSLIDIEADDK